MHFVSNKLWFLRNHILNLLGLYLFSVVLNLFANISVIWGGCFLTLRKTKLKKKPFILEHVIVKY